MFSESPSNSIKKISQRYSRKEKIAKIFLQEHAKGYGTEIIGIFLDSIGIKLQTHSFAFLKSRAKIRTKDVISWPKNSNCRANLFPPSNYLKYRAKKMTQTNWIPLVSLVAAFPASK